MKFLTHEELTKMAALLEILNENNEVGKDQNPISFEIECFDVNGEVAGKISHNGSDYVFYPSQEDD